MSKRKIAVVVASRANYGRIKSLLTEIKNDKHLELQLIVGASTLLHRFGRAIDIIKRDGFHPKAELYYVLEGENLETQAKSTGLGIIELTTIFSSLKPDIVVTVADRFETMATAIAASYLNIPLAHVQGGEVTGNIDDSVRHAITKLAHYHFPSTQLSKERLLKLGEESWRVVNTGCPSIDIVSNQSLEITENLSNKYNQVGVSFDYKKPYILVVQHPVTSSFGSGLEQITKTLNAVKKRPEHKVVLWPNIDAGSDHVAKGIRIFREKHKLLNYTFIKNFSPEDYNKVLFNAVCTVGNSSSFIREGSFLGVPSVIVGDRQIDREHGNNIVFSDYDEKEIYNKVSMQINHGRFNKKSIFGNGNAGYTIKEYLKNVELNISKRMTY